MVQVRVLFQYKHEYRLGTSTSIVTIQTEHVRPSFCDGADFFSFKQGHLEKILSFEMPTVKK